jgi:hypothetical protein
MIGSRTLVEKVAAEQVDSSRGEKDRKDRLHGSGSGSAESVISPNNHPNNSTSLTNAVGVEKAPEDFLYKTAPVPRAEAYFIAPPAVLHVEKVLMNRVECINVSLIRVIRVI